MTGSIIGKVGIDTRVDIIGNRCDAGYAEDEGFVPAREIDIQRIAGAAVRFVEQVGDARPFRVVVWHHVLVLHTERGIGRGAGEGGVVCPVGGVYAFGGADAPKRRSSTILLRTVPRLGTEAPRYQREGLAAT